MQWINSCCNSPVRRPRSLSSVMYKRRRVTGEASLDDPAVPSNVMCRLSMWKAPVNVVLIPWICIDS
jgi:hypothetical protein